MTKQQEIREEFSDWLFDDRGGFLFIGDFLGFGERISEREREIIQSNVTLLLDYKEWSSKVNRFEEALARLPEEERAAERAQYLIVFNDSEIPPNRSFAEHHFPCSISFFDVTFKGFVSFDRAHFEDGKVSFFETSIFTTLALSPKAAATSLKVECRSLLPSSQSV